MSSISRNRRGRFKSVSKSTKKSSKSLDIVSKAQMHKLEAMLKKMNLTVVLVYADWCGHCKTYKQDVWKQLLATGNKRVGMAALNEKALADSPFKNAKINGYPSVLISGPDGKPAEFRDESTGEPTNAMPNARDVGMMKGLISGAKSAPNVSGFPKTIYIGRNDEVTKKAEETSGSEGVEQAEELGVESKSLLNSPNSTVVSESEETPAAENESGPAENESVPAANNATPAENDVAENNATPAENEVTPAENNATPAENEATPTDNATAILVNSESPVTSKVLPPSASDDLLDTNASVTAVSGPANSSQLGGSLYMALLESAKVTAPAAILTAAAVMKSRRRRKIAKRATRAK
jgi:thiol-disulfide isomerase/thioredoxin